MQTTEFGVDKQWDPAVHLQWNIMEDNVRKGIGMCVYVCIYSCVTLTAHCKSTVIKNKQIQKDLKT